MGDILTSIGNIGLGILNTINASKSLKLQEESLAETKAQNAYERQKYENALANQQEGISALGSVFSSALEKSQSTDSSTESSTDSSLTGSTDASASVDGSASAADATTSKAASEGTSDASVPTQRD